VRGNPVASCLESAARRDEIRDGAATPTGKTDASMYDILDPALFPIHLFFAFVFGSLWGSFFGLCIARIPAGQSIVSPGSYCFACGKTILWHDNIPLISYWLLRGRCRACGTVFSSRHFWIELLSAVLFAWAFRALGYTWMVLPAWALTGLLIVATFTDVDHWIIPDRVSLGGAALGIAIAALPFPRDAHNVWFQAGPFVEEVWWTSPANALVGAAVGYVALWLIAKIGSAVFRKEAMGGGDVKLFACIGAFVGAVNLVYVLFLSSFLGVIVGVMLILVNRWRSARLSDEPEQSAGRNPERLADAALAHLEADDEPTEAKERAEQRKVLLNLLTQPTPKRTFQHHMMFGPYLAAGGYLTMLYYPKIEGIVYAYLNFFGGM
jgi:leader peptidase (prepilin peptidase)/N-methyltransferase